MGLSRVYQRAKCLANGFIKLIIYQNARMWESPLMDSKRIRLNNLVLLRNEAGTAAALARKLQTSPSVVSQILSPNPTRDVGDELARRAETAFNKPHGWMDHIHSDAWVTEPPKREVQRYSLAGARIVQMVADLDQVGRITDEVADVVLKMLAMATGSPGRPAARQPSLADVRLPEIDDNAPYMRKALQDMGETYAADREAQIADAQQAAAESKQQPLKPKKVKS
jgi:hypothetical protein